MSRLVTYDLIAILSWLLFFLVTVTEGRFGLLSLISLMVAVLFSIAAGTMTGPTIKKI